MVYVCQGFPTLRRIDRRHEALCMDLTRSHNIRPSEALEASLVALTLLSQYLVSRRHNDSQGIGACTLLRQRREEAFVSSPLATASMICRTL